MIVGVSETDFQALRLQASNPNIRTLLRRVALVRTYVSEEPSASYIRMTGIGELGTALAVTSNRRMLRRNTLMMETLSSTETSVLARTTRRNIPGCFSN
jgi:hypothetical protein